MISVSWNPTERELRQFAVIALFGFGLIGYLVELWTGSLAVAGAFWVLGSVTALLGLLRPNAVRPLYVALIAITLPIGLVLSNVLLGLMFYGILTPFALVFRAIGRDPLQRKRRNDVASYWLERNSRADAASYFRQT